MTESQRADLRVSIAMAAILWGVAVAACVVVDHRLTQSTMLFLGWGLLTGIMAFYIYRPSGRVVPMSLVLPAIMFGPIMLIHAHYRDPYWFIGLVLVVSIAGALYRRGSVKSSSPDSR